MSEFHKRAERRAASIRAMLGARDGVCTECDCWLDTHQFVPLYHNGKRYRVLKASSPLTAYMFQDQLRKARITCYNCAVKIEPEFQLV